MKPTIEQGAVAETEKKPRYLQMITRHAERLPSGELSPIGIAHAKAKGERLGQEAEVLKGYASDHPSGRAFDTSENISKESGITSPLTGDRYATKHVADIQYDILKPDLYHIIPEVKLLIEEATIKDIAEHNPALMEEINAAVEQEREKIVTKIGNDGQPFMDIEKLPKAIQIKIGPTRQKYQRLAFERCLNLPEVAHRMAIGLAHELVRQHPLIARYANRREKAQKVPQKDVILNTTSHGMFMESLLQEAGIYVNADGTETLGITDFEAPEFGGFIQPAESIYLEIEDPGQIPERIPVIFEGEHRPKKGRVFIDRNKLEELNEDYLQWRKRVMENAILTRHGDKGTWKINEKELRARATAEESALILSVLKQQFSELKQTSLSIDGLIRSVRLGDQIFKSAGHKSVIVSMTSGKERAQMANALAVARINQLESGYNKKHPNNKKRLDIIQVEEQELVELLADSSPDTWGPYEQMMKDEGISESEAIARWLNDLNASGKEINETIHPRESAARYRELVRQISQRVSSEQMPVLLFGVGHSGSLGQIRYEHKGGNVTAEDSPQFCEMFKFDKEGKLASAQKVEM